MEIEGKIVAGKGIASGKNVDVVTGLTNTIELQRPFFERAGFPMKDIYSGTVNVDISPKRIVIEKPDFEIECVDWSPGVTETFDLVAVEILYQSRSYAGYIYYPLPSPIKSHPDHFIELLAPKIVALKKGKKIKVIFPKEKIRLL
jgi:hypothetical protein